MLTCLKVRREKGMLECGIDPVVLAIAGGYVAAMVLTAVVIEHICGFNDDC